MASAETVKVIVRCRPMNKREKDLKCKCVVAMEGLSCSLLHPDDSESGPKTFTFDGAYFKDSTTEGIYNDVAFPLVECVLEGYNGTVFAYGQTGCGKSFTMQGVQDPPTQRGIIPRAFEHIFEVIQTTENMKFLVLASYLEIYNEEIRDLLGVETKKKLDLKEHPDKGVYVQGLSQHPVHNTSECEELMNRGWKNRSTGATLMNADSSRSHSIFTITLEMMETAGESDAIRSGKLNLVDLAGSERQAKTGSTGDRLKEATKINLSLSALGNVISALVDSKSKHIPYRDSKLTRLLQDSLGGNTKTLMVACLSPADNNYDESLSTLRYANRAKNIKNKPKINEDPKDAMLREYQEEIRKLKDMLDKQGPQETRIGRRDLRGAGPVVSVAPDESVLQKEREKVRREYEERMQRMKEEMQAEQQNNALLQANMENLKKQYESKVEDIQTREVEQKQQQLIIPPQPQQQQQQQAVEDEYQYEDDFEEESQPAGGADGVTGSGGAFKTPPKSALSAPPPDMMNSMQKQAFKRLKELQEKMVGGEKTQDTELKAKRNRRKKNMEKRMKILSDALKNVDDEDGVMLKVYDDIHEELRVKTELAKRQKAKIKSMDQEITDLTSEFQEERTDYLETIRRQEQQVKLLTAILEKIQPTIRRDCNYSNLDAIKKEATWEDEYQRWRLPDLLIVKTKLPPAGPTTTTSTTTTNGTNNLSDSLINKYNENHNPSISLNNSSYNNNNYYNNSSNNLNSSLTPHNRIQPGARFPSQTAPARLGMWDDEEDDNILKQKLQKSEQEDIAGNYFKPKKRANELLVRFQDDSTVGNTTTTTTKRGGGAGNHLAASGGWANQVSLNASLGHTNGSYNSSWGSNSSSNSSVGGGGGGGGEGGVMNNGWLETSMRRPTRLEALPTIDRKSRKKSKDVLHTLDLI